MLWKLGLDTWYSQRVESLCMITLFSLYKNYHLKLVLKKKGEKTTIWIFKKNDSLVQSFLNIKISKKINWNKLTKQANNVNVN